MEGKIDSEQDGFEKPEDKPVATREQTSILISQIKEEEGRREEERRREEEKKRDILDVSNSLLTVEEGKKQKLLVKKWEEGQTMDNDGKLSENKTIVSSSDNYGDLKEDVKLLSLAKNLPEKRRVQMEQRLKIVELLEPYLKDIPKGLVLFVLVSSATPSEHEAIPGAISDEHFDTLRENLKKSELCPSADDIQAWKDGKKDRFVGKKFFLSYAEGDRMHITLIGDEGYPSDARFEIGRRDPTKKIMFSTENYFRDERFRKFGTPIETGKKLMESSNNWIQQQKPNLEKYEQLLAEVNNLPVPSYEKSGDVKVLEFIICILKYGRADYTQSREVTPDSFMTNPEDALIMIRDIKFDTYNVFRDNLVKVQELAKTKGMTEIVHGLEFFLNEEI